MTIFRNKKNGLLYTIERVSPPKILGWWYEAKPYGHVTELHPRCKAMKDKRNAKLSEFEVVAVK